MGNCILQWHQEKNSSGKPQTLDQLVEQLEEKLGLQNKFTRTEQCTVQCRCQPHYYCWPARQSHFRYCLGASTHTKYSWSFLFSHLKVSHLLFGSMARPLWNSIFSCGLWVQEISYIWEITHLYMKHEILENLQRPITVSRHIPVIKNSVMLCWLKNTNAWTRLLQCM